MAAKDTVSYIVVFTFQKEGRCNTQSDPLLTVMVVFTFQKEGRCNQ